MEETSVSLSSGLTVSIDWLSFTVFKGIKFDKNNLSNKLNEIISFLGYRPEQFTQLPKGGMGYKSILKLSGYPIQILYDGKEDMGMHITISGSAIPELLRSYKSTQAIYTPFGVGYDLGCNSSHVYQFLSDVRKIGSITRIDIAIDDVGSHYYTMDSLLNVLEERLIVSKFRNWKNLCTCTTTGEKTGHTIYLGSRQSDIMLRVYDKMLEQGITFPWVRWELELKDSRANRLVEVLLTRQNIGSVCMELLNNYFRIIDLDDSNRSRCSTNPIWKSFVDTLDKLQLYIPDHPKTLEDKISWLKKSVFPTLAGVCMIKQNTLDEFVEEFDTYAEHISKDMLDIIMRHLDS